MNRLRKLLIINNSIRRRFMFPMGGQFWRPPLTLPTDRAPSRRAARGNEQDVVEIPTPSCQAKCCDRGPVAAHFHEPGTARCPGVQRVHG